jgi:hypothetical protein
VSVVLGEAIERGPDPLPDVFRLARYEGCHAHRRGEHAVPELSGVRESHYERDGSHGRTRQTLLTQRRGERFLVGEPEEVRAS